MTDRLGIIADDYTGALLVAGRLEAAGIAAPVAFGPTAAAPQGGVAIRALRCRVAPKEEALAGIRAAAGTLRAGGCTRLAYKACASFDATESGNIGPAADLLSELAGGAPALFSAGFPEFNVTVHQGYLFYRGRLVSESVKRLDPLTPMEDPDLVRFLSRQSRGPLALLPHGVLVRGDGAARAEWDRLLAGGARHVLADASDDADIAVTARLALESGAAVVASDPLIVALGLALGRRGAQAAPPARPDGPGAVIVGSTGPTATAQIAAFAAGHPVHAVDPADPRPDAALVAEALDWAAPRIGPRPFAIVTRTDPESVARAQARLGALGAARRAEALMGAIAAGLRGRGVRRLVVSGGETSGAVVTALGLASVRALPEGPLGSGFCVADGPAPMGLFLKSGKLGAEDVLARGLAALRPEEKGP